jgi:hypothetical protein
MSDSNDLKIVLTDAPDPADTAVVSDGLRAYNAEQAGPTITGHSPSL